MTVTKTLFIWDFDNTIVLDNTDTLVFDRLAPQVLEAYGQHVLTNARPHPWTTMIASGLTLLFERGVPSDEILAAAAEAPLPAPTAAALRAIAAAPTARSAILSDANTLFIRACLDKAGLAEDKVFQAGVYTNPAFVDDSGRIVLRPYIPEDDRTKQHKCTSCAKNLCKGEVAEWLMEGEYADWRVVYVGDGGNDYCPVSRMRQSGAVLARKGFPLHKKIVNGPPAAAVSVWETAEDLKSLVYRCL